MPNGMGMWHMSVHRCLRLYFVCYHYVVYEDYRVTRQIWKWIFSMGGICAIHNQRLRQLRHAGCEQTRRRKAKAAPEGAALNDVRFVQGPNGAPTLSFRSPRTDRERPLTYAALPSKPCGSMTNFFGTPESNWA